MADVQIHPIGIEAAPADYVIPPAAELILKGAFAVFDGSGAAGDFVPLLRIVSDAGSTSFESAQDASVAAGASVNASWFPHVAAAADGGIKYDQPNDDPQGAAGYLAIDTGTLRIGNDIPAAWDVTARDVQFHTTLGGGYNLQSDGGTFQVSAFFDGGGGGIFLVQTDVSATLQCGVTTVQLRPGGDLRFPTTLPIADPGVSGQVWNNAGVLQISP